MEGKKSSFQKPLTIAEVVNGVYKKEYVLPAIQREFVWTTQQITTLFDSLMKNYPIGSFLFWEVDKENIKNFQLCLAFCHYGFWKTNIYIFKSRCN